MNTVLAWRMRSVYDIVMKRLLTPRKLPGVSQVLTFATAVGAFALMVYKWVKAIRND